MRVIAADLPTRRPTASVQKRPAVFGATLHERDHDRSHQQSRASRLSHRAANWRSSKRFALPSPPSQPASHNIGARSPRKQIPDLVADRSSKTIMLASHGGKPTRRQPEATLTTKPIATPAPNPRAFVPNPASMRMFTLPERARNSAPRTSQKPLDSRIAVGLTFKLAWKDLPPCASAVRLREDYSAEELRGLTRCRSKDVNQSRRLLSAGQQGPRRHGPRSAAVQDRRHGLANATRPDSPLPTPRVLKASSTTGTEGPKPLSAPSRLAEFAQIVEEGRSGA